MIKLPWFLMSGVSDGRELALNFKTLKETNMQPTIAQKAPYAVDVQAGKTYY